MWTAVRQGRNGKSVDRRGAHGKTLPDLLSGPFLDDVVVPVDGWAVYELAHLLGEGIRFRPGRVFHGDVVALEFGNHEVSVLPIAIFEELETDESRSIGVVSVELIR